MTYSVPKGMGISRSRPLIRLWKGSTPKAAFLKKPTAMAQMITPHRDMATLRPLIFNFFFLLCERQFTSAILSG